MSVSADGFLRAYDLVKNKKFRSLSAPTPSQLISLAVDFESSDFVFAGCFDPFDVYLFSVKTNAYIGKTGSNSETV